MTLEECARVLAKIQLGDNRQVDKLVLAEWHDTIGHLGYSDAIAAVKTHRQESTDYLLPAHLIRNVRRMQERAIPNRELPTAATCTHKVLGGCCVHCGWIPDE
ncbi:hypothetical protein [Mycetocola reblochoni]|uniref:hypothetical protein n=1 Tax=Mycetocola reblochoni TaxID=331618 RepID=UPI000B360458|nr:hypothetical protein [Mycetocola reblochoni]